MRSHTLDWFSTRGRVATTLDRGEVERRSPSSTQRNIGIVRLVEVVRVRGAGAGG